MLYNYLNSLKERLSSAEFIAVINSVEDSIRSNRLRFNKTTNTKDFIEITEKLLKIVIGF